MSAITRNYDGSIIGLPNLPKPGQRWTAARKVTVLYAIDGGLLTVADACDRFLITREELMAWSGAFRHAGLEGLKTTKIQQPNAFRKIATPTMEIEA